MTVFAERISRLGTENAFAVSAEASAFAAQGKKVYPFHIGDINLPTPRNIVEATVRAMRDGKTCYCPNAGVSQLREVLASDINATHGTRYSADNIIIQPGGKPTIGKFIMTLMNPGDEVLYPNPGFPIYESQIEFHGGRAVPYTYVEDKDRFSLDMESLRKAITPRTRLLILNDLHNPTGHECSPQELEALAELVLAARPPRPCGRGLLRHPVQRPEYVHRLPPRDGGTLRAALHLFEEVRHDRLASGCDGGSPGDCRRHHQAERQ